MCFSKFCSLIVTIVGIFYYDATVADLIVVDHGVEAVQTKTSARMSLDEATYTINIIYPRHKRHLVLRHRHSQRYASAIKSRLT